MKRAIIIINCLSLGICILTLAELQWKIIGAAQVFFGCWLLCLHVEKKRIDREIDRFIALEKGRLILGRAPGKTRPRGSKRVGLGLKWPRVRPSSLTENNDGVILLDSGTIKG